MVMAEDEVCKDGTICQDGSTCIRLEDGYEAPNARNEDGKRQYRCDCSKIVSSRHFAGYECEYPSDDYCLFGVHVTDAGRSFCTNGECIDTVAPKSKEEEIEHVGCDCDSGFEGDFCEYITGQAPVKKSNLGLMLLLVGGFTLLSTISGIIIVKGRSRRRKKMIDDMNSNKVDEVNSNKVDDVNSNNVDNVKVHEDDVEWA